MTNIYKPRYKICFQTKNKIWINKNSRLRNFYNIRNKVILERSKKYRRFLVLKNMKWTVARRFMFPHLKKRTNFLYNYKNSFYSKQQLKKFYGKLREYQLRKMFKDTWNKEQFYRRNIFIMALEQRLDIIVYRMRLLPTIFACNQLVSHQGVYVNDNLITIPNYKVKLGDIVSIKQDQWSIFYNNIYYKLKKRFFANNLLKWRKRSILEKIQKIPTRQKNLIKKNLYVFREILNTKQKCIIFKQFILNRYKYYSNKKNPSSLDKEKLIFYKNIYVLYNKKIDFKLKQYQFELKKLRKWTNKKYINNFNKILYTNFFILNLLNKFKLIIYLQTTYWRYSKKINRINKTNYSNFLKKKKIDKLNLKLKKKINNFNFNYINSKNNLKHQIKYRIKKNFYKFNDVSDKFFLNRKSLYLINKLKYQKIKFNSFKQWVPKHHWYTPNYLEVDYKTLRSTFVRYPNLDEVIYGFECSFDKIISFYKERGL